MTEGSEAGHIVRFALPLLGGNLLQQTYNIVDTVIVGTFLGDSALAAVGATGSITYLFYTLCIGISIGAGVIIAQLFGMGDHKRMKSAIFSSAVVTAIFGIAVSIISVLLAEPVLRLLNVPDELIGTSALYMRIACGGTVAVAAYNWINAVMRALGDSKTPLIFLGAASILNVLLDLFFVLVLKLGAGGAAFATVLAQGLSAVVCIIFCFKFNSSLRLSREDMRADKKMMLQCIKAGLPIAAQNGLISVSMVALQRVTNGFGETVMAAYTVSMRIEQFVQQPFSSLNAAVSTFTGQNIGAGKGNSDDSLLLLGAGNNTYRPRLSERSRRHRLCTCERHSGGHLPNRSVTGADGYPRDRSLGNMAHHLLYMVCHSGSKSAQI